MDTSKMLKVEWCGMISSAQLSGRKINMVSDIAKPASVLPFRRYDSFLRPFRVRFLSKILPILFLDLTPMLSLDMG